MAKKNPIEVEILEHCEVEPKEGEKRQKYLSRLAKAVTGLPDKEWKKLSEDTQKWGNAAGAAVNDEKPLPDFDAAEEDDAAEEEAPKKSKKAKAEADAEADAADDDDDAEEPEDDDDDEEPAPKAKKKAKAEEPEDEEEEAPKKKAKKATPPDESGDGDLGDSEEFDGDDDDEAPKRVKAKTKAKADDDDDDEEAPKKKAKPKKEAGPKEPGAVKTILKLTIENPDWDQEKIIGQLKKAGIETSDATVATQFRNARNVMGVLKELGRLKTPKPAAE